VPEHHTGPQAIISRTAAGGRVRQGGRRGCVRFLLLARYAAIVRLAAWRRSGLSPSASPLHRLCGASAAGRAV
jgi:hypothetical protein